MSKEAIREVFITESKDLLDHLESSIVQFEEDRDPDVMNDIFRYLHTLKGSLGVAGFTEIYKFTHQLENIFDLVRSGRLEFDRDCADLLLTSIDWIRSSVTGNKADSAAIKEALQKKMSKYEIALKLKDTGKEDEKKPNGQAPGSGTPDIVYRYFKVRARFRETVFESGIDPLMIIEDLVSLGTIVDRKVNRKLLPPLAKMDPERCYFTWEITLKTKHPKAKLEEVFMFVNEGNNIVIDDITSSYVPPEQEDLKEKRIGEILINKGIVTEKELDEVITEQDHTNKKIGSIAIERGYASEKDILYALEEQDKIKKKVESATVRVDSLKLDILMNLLGEIVIEQSSIARIADVMKLSDEQGQVLKYALYGLERITRQFQEELMSIRMIPIGPTFDQFRRFVRDTAHALNKEINLKIEGGDTEIDKTVIERISDPLKHIMRNAVDHGIEPAKERVAQGKNREGTILLKAYHQEGYLYIEVTDDGRGIDLSTIRKKAESMGMLKAEDQITDDRLLSFLFMPGFSTSKIIGDLSGRGVGMDVVKTNVESIRGKVEITTGKEQGTTIRIKLPLTLAIIEGMLIRVGNSIFIIPLLSILESLHPAKEKIRRFEGKGEMILVREEYVAMLRLYEHFGIKPEHINPWDALVVVVESAGLRIALMIDDLIGQQQIVIKSIDSSVSQSRALSGAAILGDGSVALIIDIHGLVEDISNRN